MILSKGIRLPWNGHDMPHAALDLLRGCNIVCDGCYNARPPHVKPLAQLRDEVDQLLRLRRLQTLTFTGGEPSLHPALLDIARYVKSKKLRLGMLTNGLLLNETLAGKLAEVGMDIILLHIQSGQQRPDLPTHPSEDQLRALRAAKARLVTQRGMEVGLTGIAYPGRSEEIRCLLDETMESPDLSFLLLCRRCNLNKFLGIRGDIGTRMVAQVQTQASLETMMASEMPEDPFNAAIAEYGLRPFAYIGSSRDPEHPMWISFFCVAVSNGTGRARWYGVRPSWLDRGLMAMMRRIHGHYVFFFKSSRAMCRMRLGLSALSNLRNSRLWRVIVDSFRPGVVVREKHVVIEQSPELMPDGEVVYCRECPDATLVNGKLLPPCLADRAEEMTSCVRVP